MTEVQTGRVRSGHFSEEDWVDYARRQGGDQHGLEQHLAAGCRRCGRTLRFWEGVHGLAVQESSYRPPEGVVGRAKAQFALRPPAIPTRLARTVSLIFDGFRQPLPVGVRAAGPAPVQLVYKAGHYMVMLRVEPTADSDRLSVVGQILDEANPKKSLQDLAVLVLKGGEAVERTLTNHLGEFQLESEQAESLRISVGVPEIGSLTVPLPFGGGGTIDQPTKVARESGRKMGRKAVRKTKARHA
jgi:hypothetical protein